MSNVTTLINNVRSLENAIKKYNPYKSTSEVKVLALQFIRRERYNDSLWKLALGSVDSAMVKYVEEKYPTLKKYFTTTLQLIDNASNKIDFVHMAATYNGYITGIAPKEWCGWAGDIATLIKEVVVDTNNSTSETTLYNKASDLIKGTSSMDIQDILADVDANNIKAEFNKSSLTECLESYYEKNACKPRYGIFIDSIVINRDKEAFKRTIYSKMVTKYGFPGVYNKSVIDFFGTSKYGYPKEVQIKAVIKAFTEYVFSMQ